jgi:hypothetical protein
MRPSEPGGAHGGPPAIKAAILVALAVVLAAAAAAFVALGAGESGAPSCGLTGPGETVEMTEPGCQVIASDTAAEASPLPFWGSIQCASTSRYAYAETGGDPHPAADGMPQGNEAFRRLTVLNGDDFSGSRCELGENDHFTGPTVFYRQGDHLVTYFSERLPDNFPLSTDTWQTVMQMKQAQPADNGGGAPILEMEAREGKWVVVEDWHELFSFPARLDTWTRFAWDVYYSQSGEEGWLQVSADLDGDGDFDDPGERSPVFQVATLKTETEGSDLSFDGLEAGEAIPSHLRMGIYHDPAIDCPAPEGCSVEIDNVQVVEAAS